jgi:ubiquinone/menaquinone biosynthesis C-methylase UbiE
MLAANKWEAEAGKFRPNHRHPRFWHETVRRFRDHYQLGDDPSVLDVGCAKGFMLYDFKQLMPNLTIAGVDVSTCASANAKEEAKPYLRVADARELLFED